MYSIMHCTCVQVMSKAFFFIVCCLPVICYQYCRVLQHSILFAGFGFHRLLHRPGSSHTLQVLPAGLQGLHEWQHHAQVGPSIHMVCRSHIVNMPSWPSCLLALCRGMTEGITLLILAVQTGLIELQVIHRAFLLSIILFIVVASILQSMLEIADPIVLALGASRDK